MVDSRDMTVSTSDSKQNLFYEQFRNNAMQLKKKKETNIVVIPCLIPMSNFWADLEPHLYFNKHAFQQLRDQSHIHKLFWTAAATAQSTIQTYSFTRTLKIGGTKNCSKK
jgi:hypothetical protein